ncbi:MAG: glycosyltransferase family 9 protein [Chitinivibrionia bacterium]|nr:glycosyltransferase family 9 protein [Chitinivibrionia bacterium]
MEETILAIRLRQLGDILATLGALKALKQADRRRRILFMIDRQYHALLEQEPYLDELVAPPPRIESGAGIAEFIRYVDDLRSRHVSCVLDFHSNPRSALISFLSGAPRRIGFDVRVRKIAYTEREPRARLLRGRKMNITSHQSALGLAGRIGISDDGIGPLCELSAGDKPAAAAWNVLKGMGARRGAVGINAGNPYPAKAWPDGCFIELARRLSRDGRHAVVLWGPGERERAEHICIEAGTGVFLPPDIPLEDLPGFLRNLSLVVTIDSGLKHLAVAAGVPTVTVFGPTSPEEWHMGGVRDRVVSARLSCSPCRLLACPFGSPCMARVTVDAVHEAIASILQ